MAQPTGYMVASLAQGTALAAIGDPAFNMAMNTATALPADGQRAGVYMRQPTGYRAFTPKPLPPDPPIRIDGQMQSLLSTADRALGRLDGAVQNLPDPDLFVFMYVRKEAVLSSQIEGTQSSLNDVLAAEAELFDPERPKDVPEVLNYVAAMHLGLERLATLPLSVRLIREIHERLMRGVRGQERQPGEIRTTQNWIGPAGTGVSDAVFVPPAPAEVPQHLGDLETFIHADTPDLPALLKVGLVHAQFETIHPFLDGNGRVGRLLITFLLCEREILSRPVLYLSHHFRRHQQRYYELLQAIRDRGDWEAWLKFFLDGVATVANEATAISRAIVSLREAHRARIIETFGGAVGNGLTTLEHLYRRPLVQVNDVKALLGCEYPTANAVVQRLADADILSETTGNRRNRRFAYRDYIGIFAD